MKLPRLVDADDGRIIVQGVILCVLAVGLILTLAATLGLAWPVFRVAGGLST